jgi:hypothetical protein
MMIGADLSQMNSALDSLMAQFSRMPERRKGEFAQRYEALALAGAEWVEIEKGPGVLRAVVSHDLRRLCADFGMMI